MSWTILLPTEGLSGEEEEGEVWWRVEVDEVSEDPLIEPVCCRQSPNFKTLEEADEWYRSEKFAYNEQPIMCKIDPDHIGDYDEYIETWPIE